MQYDVQRSGPTTPEQATSAGAKPASGLGARFARGGSRSAASSAASATPLRERLREVLERDRALIEAHRPVEAAQARELLHEVREAGESEQAVAAEPEAKSGTHARVPTPFAQPCAPAASLFASWIDEEVTEVQVISAAPVVFESEAGRAPISVADEELDLLLEELTGVEAEVTRRGPPPVEIEAEETKRGPPPGAPAPRQRSMSGASTPEPLVTLTMARLLATHGYHVRALSIYDHLLARDPYNEELWAEAELLRG